MRGTVTPSAGLLARYLLIGTVIAFVATFLSHDSALATTFNPQGTICLDNADTEAACDGDSSPGANTDTTVNFGLGLGPNGKYGGGDDTTDSNFEAVIAFTPAEFATADPGDVPIGSRVAQLSSVATLGVVNGACDKILPVHFDMLAASIDINNVLNGAYGGNEGRNPFDADDQFDVVNGLPLGATKYPDYLKRMLVDGNGNPLQPRARLYGQTVVVDVDVSLNFVQFEPGTNIEDTQIDPAVGNPSVTVLQNFGDPEAIISPNPITDFCSPLQTQTNIFGVSKANPNAGVQGGVPLITNPSSDGTFNFMTFAASLRDADDDGIENPLDPCPFIATSNWDPRNVATAGDDDGDGVPNDCNDPTPGQNLPVDDIDQDFYVNRGDNCPLIANGVAPGRDGIWGTDDDRIIGSDNQKDSDNDFIGDACDKNPNTPDGHTHFVCNVTSLDVGAGGEAPFEKGDLLCTDKMIGVDRNGNGVFDSQEGGGPTPTPTTPSGGDDGGGDGGDTTDGTDTTNATPTPTVVGEVIGPSGGDTGNAGGEAPDTGVGSLAPAVSSIPIWATILSGLGGAGLLGSLSAFLSRIWRRRR